MHDLYQNDTAQSMKDSSMTAPRNEFDVQISKLAVVLDGVRQLMEGGGFNAVVGYFKSLTDVAIWGDQIVPQMLQNLSTSLIWTSYCQEFDRQEL